MRRISSVSPFVRSAILAACALFLLVLASPASAARIGIPKKVKDTVSKSAEQKASPQAQAAEEQVVFDDLILELTEERIGAVLAACGRVAAVSGGRPPLVARLDKANEERSKLFDKYEEKIRNDQNKRDEVEGCRHQELSAIRDRKMQEYSQRALTDPALRDKYAKLAMQYNAAAAQGDSTAIQTMQDAMAEEVLPSKEDSAKVWKDCGTMPPVSAEEKKLDAFDKEIASLNEQIRAIDQKIAAEQSSEKGAFTREQWAMAIERIQMYVSAKKQKRKDASRGYSDAEVQAMDKHLEELSHAACWN
jgi:hypothetical protein